jgi:Arc/MetJ family transcription regulator
MLRCMRTTVRLDEHLLQQAKQHAVASGKTLTAVLEQALRESLARRTPQGRLAPVRLKTFRGNGVRPGVDLDDSASLLDLMAD